MKIPRMIRNYVILSAVALGCSGFASQTVSASPWNEDAGDLYATGQNVAAGTTSIIGSLTSHTDVDLYRFSWGGGPLVFDTNPALFDTMLTLVNSSGLILEFNDDSGPGLGSQIFSTLAAGNYGIAISAFEVLPTPLGPPVLGVDVLTGWTNAGGSDSGAYTVSLSAPVGAVPEPETYAMMLAGLGLMGFVARRRKQRAV